VQKYALLVGIDNYPIGLASDYYFGWYRDWYKSIEGNLGFKLKGCKNDANKMRDVLAKGGFSPNNIHILTDDYATKSNIISALKSLLEQVSNDDYINFYFAGCGTTILTESQPREILCTSDVSFRHLNYITPNDIKEIISKKNVPLKFQIILDCAFQHPPYWFSMFPMISRNINNRYLLPPPEYSSFKLVPAIDELYNQNIYGTSILNRFGAAETQIHIDPPNTFTRYLIWKACGDFEPCYELEIEGESMHGLFTYSLCSNMEKSTDVYPSYPPSYPPYLNRAALLNDTTNSMKSIYFKYGLYKYGPKQLPIMQTANETDRDGQPPSANMWNGPDNP
jgi:hypothetical protein